MNSIIKFVVENVKFVLFVLLVLALGFGVHQCDRKQEAIAEVQKQKNNILALNDSVRTYKNEAGELSSEKLALQTDKEQLEQLNEELSNELEKERDRVEQITKAEVTITEDTTQADTVYTSAVGMQEYKITWEKRDSGEGWTRILEGYVQYTPDSTGAPTETSAQITKNRLDLAIITGIAEENGQKRIFFRSTYPNLRVTELNGAIIEESPYKSPKRWGIGPVIGYGHNGTRFTPYIGVGISYNLIQW